MTDEQIIELICMGGEFNHHKALTAFYERWAVEMKGYFVSQGLQADDASDVLQECVVKIWRNAHQYNGKGGARSWMWSIARNSLCDQLRKRKSSPEFVGVDDSLEKTHAAPAGVEYTASDCFDKGLKDFELVDRERAYVLQLLCDQIDIQDIAERIGRSYGATRTYLTDCRKKIRPFVEPCIELLTA